MISWLFPEDSLVVLHESRCFLTSLGLFNLSPGEEGALCVDRVITRCLASNKTKSGGCLDHLPASGAQGRARHCQKIRFLSPRCKFRKFLSPLKKLQSECLKYRSLITDRNYITKNLALTQNEFPTA